MTRDEFAPLLGTSGQADSEDPAQKSRRAPHNARLATVPRARAAWELGSKVNKKVKVKTEKKETLTLTLVLVLWSCVRAAVKVVYIYYTGVQSRRHLARDLV